jgi:heme exporter protein D
MLALSFNSINDFVQMGGYGAYVWSAYGLVALVFIAQVFKKIK